MRLRNEMLSCSRKLAREFFRKRRGQARGYTVTLASGALLIASAISLSRADTPSTPPVERFGPISYFEANCARCHGSYGVNYLPELAAKRGPEKMREVIDQMCAGPAQAPLDGIPLQMLIDYHQAMSDGKPYVAVTKIDGDQIEGEVTPDAAVRVEGEAGAVDAKVEGDRWSAKVAKPTKITATAKGKTATTQP